MPLRSKRGQSYISVAVGGDELDVAAGKAQSKRLAEYYVAAYYSAGAGEGGGGKWAVAVSTGMNTDLHPAARANLLARGCAPGQPWTREKLEALLRGEGRRLGTVVREEPISGRVRRVQVAKTDTWVYDVAKSVSLLACYGFDDDGWLTSVIEDAARSGMEYLAEQTAFVRRRGADGLIERQRGSAIHYSLVLERTARSADGPEDLTGLPAPHYHAHILIHGAFDRDGKYGAFDSRDPLTSGERQVASAYADLVLRQRLADRGIVMRRVDARVDEEDEGTSLAATHWEVASIPDRAIVIASERRRAILAAMAEDPQPGLRGPTGDAAAERLTKASKKASGVTDWARLLAIWRELIEDGGARAPAANPTPPGVSHGSVEAGRGDGQVEQPTAEMLAGAASRVLTRFVATRSHFKLSELRAEILQEIGGTWDRRVAPKVMSAFVARWAAGADLIPLQAQDGYRYAFSDVLRQEYRILRQWERLSADVSDDLSVLAPAAIEAHEAESGHRLDPGQRHLVEEALRRRATIGMGIAGVGKTAAGDALRRAATAAGRQVHSVALACLRARETGLDIGASRDESVRALLTALEAPEGLERHYRRGDVLLIDELSQLSDRALEGLLTAAERMDLHLVMLGDLSQQGPIGRGTMAGELMHRRGDAVVEMRVAHRFRDPVQAAALDEMHDGNALSWVRYAAQRGWLRPFAREEEAAREIARLYQEDPSRLVLTMGDNLRRDDLNALVVSHLVRRGEVSADRTVEVRPDARSERHVSLHEGQLIRLNRQLRQRAATGGWERLAKNGEVARLEAVIPGDVPERARVRLRFDQGRPAERLVEVEAGRLVATGAYALHTYKAQGATAERVVVDWTDGRGRRQTYPTLSRQRDEVVVVATARDEADRTRGVDALADRIVEAVARDDVSSPGVSMPRSRDWPAALEVDAGRSEVELTPASPRDVRLWPDRASTPDPGARETAPRDPERPVVARMLDQERIAAAMRGELDLDQLTLAELSEAFAQRAQTGQPPRLDQSARADVARSWDPGMADGPRELAPPPTREVVREPHRAATDERYSGGITVAGAGAGVEPPLQRDGAATMPVGARQPSTAQLTRLAEAEAGWPAVLERKAAILDGGLRLNPTADRGELLAIFARDLQKTWARHASEHRVTDAVMPALDRDVVGRHAAAAELLLGQSGVTAVADLEPAITREIEPALTEHPAQPLPVHASTFVDAAVVWAGEEERVRDLGGQDTARRETALPGAAEPVTWRAHAARSELESAGGGPDVTAGAEPELPAELEGRGSSARVTDAEVSATAPEVPEVRRVTLADLDAAESTYLASLGMREPEHVADPSGSMAGRGDPLAELAIEPDVLSPASLGDHPEPGPDDDLDDRLPRGLLHSGAIGDQAVERTAPRDELGPEDDDVRPGADDQDTELTAVDRHRADMDPQPNLWHATSAHPNEAELAVEADPAEHALDEIHETALGPGLTDDVDDRLMRGDPSAAERQVADTDAQLDEPEGAERVVEADPAGGRGATTSVDGHCLALDDDGARSAAGRESERADDLLVDLDDTAVHLSPQVDEHEVERAADVLEEVNDAWTRTRLTDEVAHRSEAAMEAEASTSAEMEPEAAEDRASERAADELEEIDDTALRQELTDEAAQPSEEAMAAQDALQAETSTSAEMAAEPAGMEPSGRGMEPE